MTTSKLIYAVMDGVVPPAELGVGLFGKPLEVVPYAGIAAVVSDIEPELLETADKEPLAQLAVAFEQVNIRLHQATTMVPLSFGTCASDEQDVLRVLRECYLLFKVLLETVTHCSELVVKATWDLKQVVSNIKAEDATIQALLQECENRPAGPEQAVKMGQMLYTRVETKKEKLTECFHARLAPLARDYADGLVAADDVVFNRSYLVVASEEKNFDCAVNDLHDLYGEQVKFKYIGPLPPVSFVNVDLRKSNFTLVDEARKLLELPQQASMAEIHSNFRRLIQKSHPDLESNSVEAADRCRGLVLAHETLQSYGASYQDVQLGRDVTIFPFIKDEVEKVFQVRERQLYC